MTETKPKTHYTAKELAGLPGLPNALKSVIAKAERDNWPSQKRSGKGGGKEYPVSTLPEETRNYLMKQAQALTISKPALALVEKKDIRPAELKQWQRDCMDARMGFIRLIEQALLFGKKMEEVLDDLSSASAGRVPEVALLAARANKRPRTDGISKPTLYRWWGIWKQANGDYTLLAPEDTEKTDLPPWAPTFISRYCTPQNPSIAEVIRDMQKAGQDAPNKDQVARFLKKYSKLDIMKGRMTGAELARHTAFTRRDTSDLLPLQVCVCDGHSFKGKVAHPKHGRPFKPEVCTVIDAATRFIPGWSAGLAESNETVADAVRHALTVNDDKPCGGMITILYSDNGGGNTAIVNADPILGRFARLGITFKTGRPGNPRARGLIEIVNKTLWIPLAKKLPTYVGKDMDSGIARKVYLHLEKQVKEARKSGSRPNSPLLISWEQFLELCAQGVHDYNNRPHSSLPKIVDESGSRRYMTPQEAWNKARSEGWTPEILGANELADLFRPWVISTTRNAEVRLFNNRYFNRILEHFHKQQVIVEYAVQDGSKVLVRNMDTHEIICEAGFQANTKGFFERSAIEEAEENRYKTRKATAERRIEEIEAEFHGVKIGATQELTPLQLQHRLQLEAEYAAEVQAAEEVQATKEARLSDLNVAVLPKKGEEERDRIFIMPSNDLIGWKKWCELDGFIRNGFSLWDDERAFYEAFQHSSMFRAQMRLLGRK